MPTDFTPQLPLFGDEEKRCTRCKQLQPVHNFPPRTDRPGKYGARCFPCETAYRREYAAAHREQIRENYNRFAQKHPERILAWSTRYRTEHAEKHNAAVKKCKQEHKAQYAEYGRKYRLSHLEEAKAKSRRHYYRHQNECQQRSLEWSKSHREIVARLARSVNQRRRARKRGNGGSFSAWDWECVKARYDWTCLRCGRREPDVKLHADHVVPLILGGFNIASNLEPLCARCNAIKGRRFIDYRPDPYRID